MDKIKAAIAASLAGREPTDTEQAEAIIEGLDVIASIADSLKRIADNGERIAECVATGSEGKASTFNVDMPAEIAVVEGDHSLLPAEADDRSSWAQRFGRDDR